MDVNINGKVVLDAKSLVKIDPKKQLEALDTAAKNQADDIFLRAGGDLFVASGRGFKEEVKPGQTVEVAGIKGKVTAVDNETPGLYKGFQTNPVVGLGPGAIGGIAGGIALSFKPGLSEGTALASGVAIGAAIAGGVYHLIKKEDFEDIVLPHYGALKEFEAIDRSIPVSSHNGLSDELTAGVVASVAQLILQKTRVKDLDKKLAADYAGTVKQYVENETAQKYLLKLGETLGDHIASNVVSASIGSLSGVAVELTKDAQFRALYDESPVAFGKEILKRGGKKFAISLGAALVAGKVADKLAD